MTTDLDGLLELQALDTRIDQLRHSLANLAERDVREQAEAAVEAIDGDLAKVRAQHDELLREQKRIEDGTASIEAKRAAHNDRLYGGTVTNARELQDLQEEVESLGRRITKLEDDELEVMEAIEPVAASIAEFEARRSAAVEALEAAEQALTVAEAENAAEADRIGADRAVAAESVPTDLLERYESLRASRGGVVIARLEGDRCGGCHLTLSAVEVAALRKQPGELGACEECGRLLVP